MFSSAQNFRTFDLEDPHSPSTMTKRSAAAASETVKEFPVHVYEELDLSKYKQEHA